MYISSVIWAVHVENESFVGMSFFMTMLYIIKTEKHQLKKIIVTLNVTLIKQTWPNSQMWDHSTKFEYKPKRRKCFRFEKSRCIVESFPWKSSTSSILWVLWEFYSVVGLIIILLYLSSPWFMKDVLRTQTDIYDATHWVKSVQIRSFFWSVFSCIQSEYRKIRTRKNPYLNTFHTVTIWENSYFTKSSTNDVWRDLEWATVYHRDNSIWKDMFQ